LGYDEGVASAKSGRRRLRTALGLAIVAASYATIACEVFSGLASLEEVPGPASIAPHATDAGPEATPGATGPGVDGQLPDARSDAAPSTGPYLLSVVIGGTRLGTISSSPPGINCDVSRNDAGVDGGCTTIFDLGTHVALTVVAPQNFDWGGDCADDAGTTCQLVMDSDKLVYGNFSTNSP